MSIASEITDLQTNLAAAKTAVENKGGTIGDTGLAGLASEIASIPSGSADTWGSVTYLDSNNIEQTVTIQNEDQYFLLCKYNTDVTIGGSTFNLNRITKVALGNLATYADANFLRNCPLLTTITGVEHIISTSNYFLAGCPSLNCPLNFENLHACGAYFLQGCTSLNSQVLLPNLASIANYFMNDCTSFAQPLTFRDGITYIGNSVLYNANSFNTFICNCNPNNMGSSAYSFSTTDVNAPMYVNGITVSGTYASELKSYFSNRDTSPYRKLI